MTWTRYRKEKDHFSGKEGSCEGTGGVCDRNSWVSTVRAVFDQPATAEFHAFEGRGRQNVLESHRMFPG